MSKAKKRTPRSARRRKMLRKYRVTRAAALVSQTERVQRFLIEASYALTKAEYAARGHSLQSFDRWAALVSIAEMLGDSERAEVGGIMGQVEGLTDLVRCALATAQREAAHAKSKRRKR